MHFRYLLRIKLLQTFSFISIVVSASLGRFSPNGSYLYYIYTKINEVATVCSLRLLCSLALNHA